MGAGSNGKMGTYLISQQIQRPLSWLSPLIKLNTIWVYRPLGWSDTCGNQCGGLEPEALTQIYGHHVSKTKVTDLVNLLHFHRVVTRLFLWNPQLWEDTDENQEGKCALHMFVAMCSVYGERNYKWINDDVTLHKLFHWVTLREMALFLFLHWQLKVFNADVEQLWRDIGTHMLFKSHFTFEQNEAPRSCYGTVVLSCFLPCKAWCREWWKCTEILCWSCCEYADIHLSSREGETLSFKVYF